jgi:hypothetical protein
MNGTKNRAISRREFARHAVLASAAASLAATAVMPADARELLAQSTTAPPAGQAQDAAKLPKLSAEGQVEAESRAQTILNRHGSRFSEAQKTDIRRLCILAQPPLDRLRAYALANSDGPALYLKPLVEREKKPVAPAKSAAGKTAAAKKS